MKFWARILYRWCVPQDEMEWLALGCAVAWGAVALGCAVRLW